MAGPLDGIRVLDLTAMVSGPLATCVLADQGADVVKAEPPVTGDLIRHIGTSRGGLSAIFATLNRNKRSIVLDLGNARGREVLLRLVARADVFVQNFRPGVIEAMGLGEPELRRVNPALVYVSTSGIGETGRYAQRRVYDIVIQALSGMADAQADPRTGEPELVRNLVCDEATAAASLAGFLAVRRTADGFMTIFAISDREFEGLCRALGRPELARDPRFEHTAGRMRHAAALAALVDEVTRRETTAGLAARLDAEDVPHAPVNRVEALHEDPQVVASGLVVELVHATAGRPRTPRPVARFDRTPASLRRAAPILGEHVAAILAECGFSAEEVDALREEGALG